MHIRVHIYNYRYREMYYINGKNVHTIKMSLYQTIRNVVIPDKPITSVRFSRRKFNKFMQDADYETAIRMACSENTKSFCDYCVLMDECRDYRVFAYEIEEEWYSLLNVISKIYYIKTSKTKSVHDIICEWKTIPTKPALANMLYLRNCLKKNEIPDFVSDFINFTWNMIYGNERMCTLKNKLKIAYFKCLKVAHFQIECGWKNHQINSPYGFSNNLAVTQLIWQGLQPKEYKTQFIKLLNNLKELGHKLTKAYISKICLNLINNNVDVSDQDCAICLQPLCKHEQKKTSRKRKRCRIEKQITLSCGHTFHENCILRFCENKIFESNMATLGKCPLCRAEIAHN